MCKLGANTYRRKDGRYEIRIIVGRKPDGKYEWVYGLGKTLNEAQAKAEAKRQKRNEDIISAERERILFRTVVKKWLKHYGLIRKPSTIAKYNRLCDSYLLPYFGEKLINEITSLDVAMFGCHLTSIDKDGVCLSRSTALTIMNILNLIKAYAENNGYVVNFTTGGTDIKTSGRHIEVLSKTEQHRLIDYVISNPTPINLGIYLSLKTGIRIGELCGLRWGDISPEEKSVSIKRTLQRISNNNEENAKTKVTVGTPKSFGSIRKIPLPEDVYDVIAGEHNPEQYFLANNVDQIVEPRTVQYHFKKILMACDIKPIKFHILRHTFATNSIEAGVDVKCLSAILGHSNIQITLDSYVHPTFEMKKKSMAKISAGDKNKNH